MNKKQELIEFVIGNEFIAKPSLQDKFVSLLEETISEQSRLSVVVLSNMRKALKTVVDGYEGDGMEGMDIRDNIFYETCKEALEFEKTR